MVPESSAVIPNGLEKSQPIKRLELAKRGENEEMKRRGARWVGLLDKEYMACTILDSRIHSSE